MSGEYSETRPYMAVVELNDEIVHVLLRTPPHPVLVSFAERAPNRHSVSLAVHDLRREYGHDIAGITGDKQVVRAFADAWQEVTGTRGERKVALRIYKLTHVKPFPGVPGTMRPITEGDSELVADWIIEFNRDTFNEDFDRDRAQAIVNRYLSADHTKRGMMLWEVGGEPVSMAGYSGPTPRGIRIASVYTPPERRRCGFARACVSALSEHLLDGGRKFCFLFTDLSNRTSNHIYQEIGYRAVSDVDSYSFT